MEAFFAAVGAVLLIFGVFGLFAGAGPGLVAAHFSVGLVLLGFAAARGFGRLSEFAGRDAARSGANVLFQTVVLALIGGLLAFVSVRNAVHWDWTDAGIHSLSPASVEVLAQIPEDPGIEIYAFFADSVQVRDVLELYSYASDRVRYSILNPNRRPELAQHFEIRSDGIVIVCNGPCETAKGTVRIAEASEEELTKAIRSVISVRKKISFLTGHGERDLDDNEASGLSRAKLGLEDENVGVDTLLLANLGDVPEGVDAVVVAGPTHSLLPRELAALDRYLRKGGSVLVLADPMFVTNLESTVLGWGIQLGNDVIVDEQLALFAGPQLGVQPVVSSYGAHPVTAKMAGRPTLFQLARSVIATADQASEVVELASTGPTSWAESDLERFRSKSEVALDEGKDRAGPVALAAARSFAVEAEGEDDTESKPREGRLVVVGDADFATNRYISELFNADFFLNITSWLVGEEAFISVERRIPRASTVVMSQQQVRNFSAISVFFLPEALLLLGIFRWWRRRS